MSKEELKKRLCEAVDRVWGRDESNPIAWMEVVYAILGCFPNFKKEVVQAAAEKGFNS